MSVQFEGDDYDLTDFSHPGGKVFRAAFNTDATLLIHSYHPHVERVRKTIAPFKVSSNNEDKSKYQGPLYAELKRRVHSALKAKSLDPGADWLLRLKMISLFLWFIGSFIWLVLSTTPTTILLASVSLGVSGAMADMNVMHDASHMAIETGTNVGWNYIWQMCGDITGISSIGWRFQHVVQHHIHTDDDQDPEAAVFYPLVRNDHRQPHIWWIHYLQPILMFVPVFTLTFCFLMHDTIHVLTGIYTYEGIRKPKNTHHSKQEWTQFAISKLCLVVVWITLWTKGGFQAFVCYVVFGSYILSNIDVPGHFTHHPEVPLKDLPKSIQEGDIIDTWLLEQFQNTNSFAPSLNGFFGGLNMQIEHHMFPRISHRHYVTILRPIFQEFCKEHNIPYNDYSLLGVTGAVAKRFLLLSLPPPESKKLV